VDHVADAPAPTSIQPTLPVASAGLASPDGKRRMARGARLLFAVFAGTFLVQLAWMLTVPPFRGIDEHEHAYKAAAVARGDWSSHHKSSPEGWGEFVLVPRDIVEAAGPVCSSKPYTTPDNCTAQPGGGPLVWVASNAARYNPVFYGLIGTVARPFHGTHALMAMRISTAATSAFLFASAFTIAASWARSRWPLIGLLAGMTPMVLYSSSIAAPNGPEMGSAALLWASLLGLTRQSSMSDRQLIGWSLLGAVPLVTLRGMGPLWCLLIVVCVLPLASRARLSSLVRTARFWVGAGVVTTATGAAAWWTLNASIASQTLTAGTSTPKPVGRVLPNEWFLWFVESIGAFPGRTNAAPTSVYAVAVLCYGTLLVAGLRRATPALRWSMVMIPVLASLVGILATLATYDGHGPIWQGRYMLPLTAGMFLLAGVALDAGPKEVLHARCRTLHLFATTAALVALSAPSLVRVRGTLLSWDAHAYDAAWLQPSIALIVAVVAVGVVLQVSAVAAASPAPRPLHAAERDASSG